ncbi:hypothetical protein ACN081_02725 [Rothia sp. P13129]|uniref:hypothetical protein n=1 Tax=Rothia sp. P13129 TaxID=3402664 RepID=UPI003AD01151
MLNSRLGLTHGVLWVVSSLWAIALSVTTVFFVIDQDRYGIPEGISSSFSLVETPHDITEQDLIQQLTEQAQIEHVNIYKTVPSAQFDKLSTTYYLFSGQPDTVIGNIDQEYFPSFSKLYTPKLLPGDSLQRDHFLGTYFVQGDVRSAQNIFTHLQNLGSNGQVQQLQPAEFSWAFSLIFSTWAAGIVVLSCTLILMMVQMYSLRLSIQAIRRTVGENPRRVVFQEYLVLGFPLLIPALISFLALSGYSFFVADGYRLQTIFWVSLQILAILLCLWVCSCATVYVATRQYSLGALAKGKKPLRLLATLSLSLVITGSYCTIASLDATVHHFSTYTKEERANSVRAHGKDLVQPLFSYLTLTRVGEEKMQQIQKIYDDFEKQNHVFLSSPLQFGEQEDNSNFLLVNLPYLRYFSSLSQELVDTIANDISSSDNVVLVIPQDLEHQSENIKHQIEGWVSFQEETARHHHTIKVLQYSIPDTGILPLLGKAPTDITYRENPVLVVSQFSSKTIPVINLGTADLTYSYKPFKAAIENHHLSDFVIAYRSVQEEAQLEHANRQATLVMSVAGAVLSLLSLAVGSTLLAITYYARHTTALFLHKTTGATWLERHGNFLYQLIFASTIPISMFVALYGKNSGVSFALGLGIFFVVCTSSMLMLRALEKNITQHALEIS